MGIPHNLLEETLVKLAQAHRYFPMRISRDQVRFWARNGLPVREPQHKLESIKCGGQWYTSREAIRRFLDATALEGEKDNGNV